MRAIDAISTVKVASEVANSQVVWSILFIGLLGFVLWSQRKDKIATEEKQYTERKELIEIQKNFGEALTNQSNAMKEISHSLVETNKTIADTNRSIQTLEMRIDNIERNSYRLSKGGDD